VLAHRETPKAGNAPAATFRCATQHSVAKYMMRNKKETHRLQQNFEIVYYNKIISVHDYHQL